MSRRSTSSSICIVREIEFPVMIKSRLIDRLQTSSRSSEVQVCPATDKTQRIRPDITDDF